ncbi:MAG: DUF1700 domain-containing protein [Spirochaetales bacterium]|nr:DUF1700 domain-containing protein [Spirochaetales bacterium]
MLEKNGKKLKKNLTQSVPDSDSPEVDTGMGGMARAMLVTIPLAIFNIILILGPVAIIAGSIVILAVTSICVVLIGLTFFLMGIFQPFIPVISFFPVLISPAMHLAAVFAGIFLFSTGNLMAIGLYKLSRLLFKYSIEYIKLNYRIITKSEDAK